MGLLCSYLILVILPPSIPQLQQTYTQLKIMKVSTTASALYERKQRIQLQKMAIFFKIMQTL